MTLRCAAGFRRRLAHGLAGAGLLALLACGSPAARAQSSLDPSALPPGNDLNGPIGFEADQVSYAYDPEIVTASGNVVLRRGDQSVRADTVTWDRKTGKIMAQGNIRLVDADGNQLYTDTVELTDQLKAGAMQNLLLALRDGGRLAAITGERDPAGNIILSHATYSGCAVEDEQGCPRNPTWQVNASRVVYAPDERTIRFSGARLRLFGVTLMPLPKLAIASDGRPINGLLIPDLQLTANNGVAVSDTWYQRLGPNQDLAVTGYLFSEALPMVAAHYRALVDDGAFQITGYATRSRRISVSGSSVGGAQANDFRGYLHANGRFQFSPEWSLTGSLRLATDRTFLRRYDINRDDRLRSTFDLQRIGDTSYFSFSGWATQTMRVAARQGLIPVALPVLDWRKRLADPVLGGRLELQANSLAITRTSGQDTQRAFARAQWDLSRLTPWGQEVTFTAMTRGDIYHSAQNDMTNAFYPGRSGWQGRAMAIGAVDVRWPLVGAAFGGNQVLTPRLQLVASPPIRNLAVPNEDSRAIDLEDSNLFALNRFPGYDRVEDLVRLTYGFDWELQRPGLRVRSTLGQSVRVGSQATVVPDGTGLSDRMSDIVGRTEVRFRDKVKLTWRYRLDKDNLAVRRNEIDATIGTERSYVEMGYLRLNRDISSIEDLRDREELRAAGRFAFARYWSVFGATLINLTDRQEDPLNTANGFQPLRTRLGLAYNDDCLELALTWRRDYVATGDAGRGNTFQIHFALRNLGFR
ncbi:LPS assembly protein LptD [Novosphingobium sp.]|uniref:LPS-assembly protein LptD n=1 Tax=Novosphingobium sp. TaxID=1874826 RepID=UPI002607BD86|nr:LPS assembly protein LptD [Novosphingobium sp.]